MFSTLALSRETDRSYLDLLQARRSHSDVLLPVVALVVRAQLYVAVGKAPVMFTTKASHLLWVIKYLFQPILSSFYPQAREAMTVVSSGGTHTDCWLHQMMLEDRDFERDMYSLCCDSRGM